MSVEFVDTNVLIYGHDGGAGKKHADPSSWSAGWSKRAQAQLAPAKHKAKPTRSASPAVGESSPAQERPEFIDRLYRKIQNAPPGKKKWAAEAVEELNRLMDLSEKLLADAASVRGLAIIRAQSSPEYLDTLKGLDPLAPAFARGVRARLELLKEGGGAYTTDKVAEILGISPQAVIKRYNAGKLRTLRFFHRHVRPTACASNLQLRT